MGKEFARKIVRNRHQVGVLLLFDTYSDFTSSMTWLWLWLSSQQRPHFRVHLKHELDFHLNQIGWFLRPGRLSSVIHFSLSEWLVVELNASVTRHEMAKFFLPPFS